MKIAFLMLPDKTTIMAYRAKRVKGKSKLNIVHEWQIGLTTFFIMIAISKRTVATMKLYYLQQHTLSCPYILWWLNFHYCAFFITAWSPNSGCQYFNKSVPPPPNLENTLVNFCAWWLALLVQWAMIVAFPVECHGPPKWLCSNDSMVNCKFSWFIAVH